ncbi:MAG: hypothetical protein OEY50_09180 [Nitrospinota bacterium]|nr:hypothetical protein [Nitrospinota bacterium]MDH5677676.1 hypothetical protein [Nitrospinota bacterium]
MKKKSIVIVSLVLLALLIAGVVFIPNPVGARIMSEAKANGYIQYHPLEAYDMARMICTQCHSDERIKMYCPRCGPPFVAVVPHMQTFIENYRKTKPDVQFVNITEPQAVAIVQVWNALVGNWEKDFREQDILKLIGHYDQLKALYLTPVDQRPIEAFLSGREELKIGHMTGLEQMQRKLGTPENNPKPLQEPTTEANPSDAGANQHNHDHDHADHKH